jgi:ATP-binding cassette subfamily B multidrug efflux pump
MIMVISVKREYKMAMHYRLNRRFFPWLIAHSFEYWYYYSGAFLSLFLLHSYSSELPTMAKNLGDSAMNGTLADIEIKEFFFIAFFILLFRTLSRLLFFYPARIQQRDLRMELVRRIEEAPARNYKDFNEGMLFQTIYNDLNRIRGFMGFALLQLGNFVIASAIFIPKINNFNSEFLWAFTPLIGTVIIFSVLIFFFQPWVKKGMDQYADVQNFLLESYDAKKTIQNYHSENDFKKLFDKLSGIELRTFYISSMGRAFSFPVVKLGVGGSLIWAALIVKNNGLEASDLIYFSSFLFLILEPLLLLSWIGIVASQGYASWVRIKELITSLDQKIEDEWIVNGELESLKLPLWENLIPLNVPKLKWTVLVGETGCGKSWVLENFALYLSEKNIPYSMIHQEPYLYNDTIVENIFLGLEQTPEKLSLAKFYLKEFGLNILNDNLDELLELELGENGKKVSGGQAKRISLIRSLVSDIDYILWDDPFSSVDLLLESEIINSLRKTSFIQDKTFILTSHRLSTVKSCDEVIYLGKKEGIIEQGTIANILNSQSKVDTFFEKQHI